MHISAGQSRFVHRYPQGRRANTGVFCIPESTGAGMGAQSRAEGPDFDFQYLEGRSFSTECGP